MGVLTEVAQWAADVFKIETDTVWKGGDDGDANKQGQALANRTSWLKEQVEALALAISNLFSAQDLQKASAITSDAGGTADAITGVFSPAIAALTHGMTLYVRAASANATTTPTFTPNSEAIAAKTIVKGAGAALAAGDIAGAGHWIKLQYDATLDKWVLLNPATGVSNFTQTQADARYTGIGYMMVRDEKSPGTHGGSSVVGTQTRVLNTVSSNTISGASLASNQITLPAGTYRVRGRAPAYVNTSKAFLYNITDAANQIIGISVNGISGAAADQAESYTEVSGRFTIAASKVFELRQYTSEATATVGLGAAVSQGTEVYSYVEIIKES